MDSQGFGVYFIIRTSFQILYLSSFLVFFDCIFMEYGNDGLKKAIQATKLHIDYRRKCGHTVDSVEKICNDFERKV